MSGVGHDNPPEHYDNAIETIDCILAMGFEAGIGFCRGNIVKYVMRYKSKGGVRDLHKAQWYMNLLVGIEEWHVYEAASKKVPTARELIKYALKTKGEPTNGSGTNNGKAIRNTENQRRAR